MSANPRPEVTDNKTMLERLAVLIADAILFFNKKTRDVAMKNRLLLALQLFKDNRLGEVMTFQEKTSLADPDMKALLAARRVMFKEKIAKFGLQNVTDEFYKLLPWRLKRLFMGYHMKQQYYSLQEIVLGGQDRLVELFVNMRGFTEKNRAQLDALLHERGLYIGMTLEEIHDCFGEVPKDRDVFDGSMNHDVRLEGFNALIEGAGLWEDEKIALGEEIGFKSIREREPMFGGPELRNAILKLVEAAYKRKHEKK